MIRYGNRILEGHVITASVSEVQVYALKFRKPQDLTHTGLKALQDVRLAYKIACIVLAYSGHLSAEYKWNAGATTAVGSRSRFGLRVVHVKGDPEPALNCSRVPNEMNLLVKWFHMCSAAGYSSDLVLIAAVSNLKDGKFFARNVKGLSGASEHKTIGWMYACNSRSQREFPHVGSLVLECGNSNIER